MKKYTLYLFLLTIMFPLSAQIKINSIGNIGLGGNALTDYKLRIYGATRFDYYTPGTNYSGFASLELSTNQYKEYGMHISGPTQTPYKLYVVGDAYAHQWLPVSDKRLKKNIRYIDNNSVLPQLMKVKGKKYEFKNQEELQNVYIDINTDKTHKIEAPQLPKGRQYGLIAQELEKLFPELVQADGYSGTKAINYDGMIPLLLEAIKQLNTEKEIIKKHICQANTTSTFSIENNEYLSLSNSSFNRDVILSKNFPNPCNYQTNINMYLPLDIRNAELHICNSYGTEIQSYAISRRGDISIMLDASSMPPGNYYYMLVADGKSTSIHEINLAK
ncbi:MAG: tail fiber domain-containing protein [bacterium]